MTRVADIRNERAAEPVARLGAVASARRTILLERDALVTLEAAFTQGGLGEAFARATDLIARATGRVVMTGIGKSGLIARKFAATLASTGTPAFFIHPADASHGDLGMIAPSDVVIALSWSGETDELADIISYCARFSVPLIGCTSREASTLARGSTIVLCLPPVIEACPNQLAPTSSCAIQAAIGDALAVALIERRGFSAEDFRIIHPRGRLGAQLMRAGDLMSSGADLPRVAVTATILDAVLEISLKRLGATAIVDGEGRLVGAFTDGDLRRSLPRAGMDAPVRDHMTSTPSTTEPSVLLSEALAIMTKRNITQLFVCDGEYLVGILHLHDILKVGVV